MDTTLTRVVATLAATVLLGACATLPAERGREEVAQLLAAHRNSPPQALAEAGTAQGSLLAAPLTPDDAVALAWRNSPRVERALAELGIAAAEAFDAGRLRNPTLSASRMGGSDGCRSVGISAVVSDLLTLPMRRRLGAARWRAAVAETAHALLEDAARTRKAYYRYVGAMQVAALRDAVAEAASTSAALAQRFRDAGNISALQLAREQAAATIARTDAATARADRLEARMDLAVQLGLAGVDNRWRTPDRLPLPPTRPLDVDALLASARDQRLDLAAARAALNAGENAATFARRYAWLGDIEFGYEREYEDGERLGGPTLALSLPLFHQGQGDIARADAGRDMARATLRLHEQVLERDIRAGIHRLETLRDIITSYRDALIPQREAIVARELERYNFMLIGAFELIQARQQEYDAYQRYLEAIRDYWIARSELAHAVGGPLPGDDADASDGPAASDVLERGDDEAGGHHHHHHGAASAGTVDSPAPPSGHADHIDRDGSHDHDGHDGPDDHDEAPRADTPADHSGHEHTP